MDEAALTDYEAKRLRRMEENRKMLQSLDIPHIPQRAKAPPRKVLETTPEPTRRSRRVQAKRQAREELEAQAEKKRREEEQIQQFVKMEAQKRLMEQQEARKAEQNRQRDEKKKWQQQIKEEERRIAEEQMRLERRHKEQREATLRRQKEEQQRSKVSPEELKRQSEAIVKMQLDWLTENQKRIEQQKKAIKEGGHVEATVVQEQCVVEPNVAKKPAAPLSVAGTKVGEVHIVAGPGGVFQEAVV